MRPRAGFSLAEVVVSIFLLGLVLTAVLNLFPASMLLVDGSEARYQATCLAQAELESQAQEPWGDLRSGGVKTFEHVLGKRTFTCTVTTTPLGPSLCHIVSSTSWKQSGVVWKVMEECDVSALHR